MIIDCHTHVNCPISPCDSVEFQEYLEKVDGAFVLTMQEDSNKSANERVSKYIASYEKAIGYAVVDPLRDNLSKDYLNYLRDKLNFKGFVLYCPEFGMHACHSKAMMFYEKAQDMKMPVFFHNCGPFGPDAVVDFAQPYHLDEIAVEFPDLKIIIAGLGYPFTSQAMCLLQKNPNMFSILRVSAQKPWELYNLVTCSYESGIMDKLFFGSGFPQGSVNESLEALLGFKRIYSDTQLATVPREEIRAVVERNCLEILGIA